MGSICYFQSGDKSYAGGQLVDGGKAARVTSEEEEFTNRERSHYGLFGELRPSAVELGCVAPIRWLESELS